MRPTLPASPGAPAQALRVEALTPARLILTLALVAIFAMAAKPSVDTDTWWHLRAGAWMAEHRQVLQHDEFSSTRYGQPWVNHSWLAQLPLYWLWQTFGYAGLNWLVAGLVTVAFVLIARLCRGSPYVAAFALVLAAATSSIYWSARPQLFSFALAAVFLHVVESYRWHGTNRLWMLPPLMLLWVNLHGGFALGFMLLLGTLAGQVLSRLLAGRAGRSPGVLPWRGVGALALVTLACAAVVPLNPYGATLFLYPLRTVSIGVLQDFIQEWQSPNFHDTQVQVFIGLLLAVWAAVGLSGRRIDLTDLALFSGFTYLALMAARNIPVVALLAAPIIVRHAAAGLPALRAAHPRLAALLSPEPAPPTRLGGALNALLLGLAVVAALGRAAWAGTPAANAAFVREQVPVAAAGYVAAAHPAGPMFNAYNWGGYLIWRLYPDYPVFVDGRTDLYDDALLREYLATATGQPGDTATLDRYGFNLVLVEARSLLADHLAASTAWRRLYSDDLAVVYGRAAGGRRP